MSGRDLGASVRQRLLNQARSQGRPFQELLQYFDIGFGDVIVPRPMEVEYPAMLEFPPPVLMAYPKETVVAEKLEALTVLGLLNSRLKDYYDIALLARLYPFDGGLLAEAIRSTFRHRGTAIDATPIGLTDAFISDPARAAQWRAFVRRSRFDSEFGLDEIVEQVRRFAWAPLAAVAGEDSFHLQWRPAGPWE